MKQRIIKLFHSPFRETNELSKLKVCGYRRNSANIFPVYISWKKEQRKTEYSLISWIFAGLSLHHNVFSSKINSQYLRSYASNRDNLIPYLDPKLGIDESNLHLVK